MAGSILCHRHRRVLRACSGVATATPIPYPERGELGEPHWFEDRADAADVGRVRSGAPVAPLPRAPRRPWPSTTCSGGAPPRVSCPRDRPSQPQRDASDDRVLRHVRGAGPHRLPGAWLAGGRGHVRSGRLRGRVPSRAARTASSGRALEVNTRLPMPPEIVGWWYVVGGEAVSFGSDADQPSLVGHGSRRLRRWSKRTASTRPRPHDFWRRRR